MSTFTAEEIAAVDLLRKRGRLLVIVIPKGVPSEKVMELKRRVDAELERLVQERGAMQ